MKPKEIKELIEFISETGLEEVNVETSEVKIKVKKSQGLVSAGLVSAPQVISAPAPAASAPAPQPAEAPKKPDASDTSEANLVPIKSPMIGTFYKSPNPETAPFIKVGDVVKAGDTVCIIEAMKLFNEIESEASGKVVKILVDDAEPVEYDQPLFLVDPS